MTNDTPKPGKVDAEALLSAASEDFKLSEDAFSDQRKKELEDLKFEAGEHFTNEELSYLKQSGRPDVVMDQTSGQVAKVTNQPVHRIVVLPNGGGSDPTSAQYWQGICRRVEQLSNAKLVYKWARRHAVVMGRGFWRVRPGFFSHVQRRADGQYPLSVFEQDIRIQAILHQHAVYEDPRCQQLDFSDQRFGIIGSDVEWSMAKTMHAELKNHTAKSLRTINTGIGDCPPAWANDKTVRIAERYWIEDEEFTLCAVRQGDGSVLVIEKKAGDQSYPKESIVNEHTFRIPKVQWMKYVHGIVLEGPKPVPGRYVPIVKIVGERRMIDGKEDCRGMVRMAKGPQRLVDFYEMRLARAVDLSAEGTWTGSVRAIGDWQDVYANAHKNHPGVLLFNDLDESGNPIAPPVFVHVAPQVQHLVIAAQRAGMNLRAVLGVPDVTPEESKPEQSGKAIRARQAEQMQATSHYGDSTEGGVRFCGQIIMSQGREVYDAPRIFRINGKDEKEIAVLVSGVEPNEADFQSLGVNPDQIEHMLRTDLGEFDVTVAAGQLKDTQRQETTDVLTSIMPVLPPPMAVKAAGALVRTVDGLGELADTLAPPDDTGMVPKEAAEAEIQKREQAIEQLQGEIQQLQQAIDGKVIETQSKERIAKEQAAVDYQMNRDKLDNEFRLETAKQAGETERAKITAFAAMNAPQPQASPEFGV